MNIFIWIVVTLVSFTFIFFSTVKIFGVPKNIFTMQKETYFDNYGISRIQMRLIGLLELFGGMAIWFWATQYQWLAQIGMAVLVIVTLGAMSFHARFDSLTKDGMPAIIQFTLNAVLLTLTIFFV